MIEAARASGKYDALRDSGGFITTDGSRASIPGQLSTVKVSQLDPDERRSLLMDTPAGLEPASLWVSENGTQMAVSTWKDVFRAANRRCAAAGLDLHGHPHMLRHTFAVLTLEQLQRGHIDRLRQMTASQRQHYTRIFGDPLDWLRRRLGHKSVTTTQVYLHALEELEMETRTALLGASWDASQELLSQLDSEAR